MECEIKKKNYKKVYDINYNIIGKTYSDNNKIENQIYKQIEILNMGNTCLQVLPYMMKYIDRLNISDSCKK